MASSSMGNHSYEYDLVVLGGGSGGLAAAKEAAKLGAKVICLDFVKPSPAGTTWGLGGTCVNVGCIPKKLMHQAGILGESFSDAKEFGWNVKSEGHDWNKMVTAIQDHIGSLNFGYRTTLRDKNVEYMNAYGAFVDAHTITATKKSGKVQTITADKFIIAVGGRPSYLDVPGARECCITSDDVFSLPAPPGKTLCVGASYISLETAGFLAALGYDTSVAIRSVPLRGFDTEIADKIVGFMERHGTNFMRDSQPSKFEKTPEGKIKVTVKNTVFGSEFDAEFDTVVLAVGRFAVTEGLNLAAAGVERNPKNGKIPCIDEVTNVPHIYAVGDVLDTRQELTPVAIKAGMRLVQRIYNGGTLKMDYDLVPTTVFTPLEYGCIGMSEELAVETFGADNVEVYQSYFKPLEWVLNHEEHDGVAHREDNACYAKLITNLADDERVVGFHYVGPGAGEVTQGYAVAMKMGAKKSDFDGTVGIHPTVSEEFTLLSVTKRSGVDAAKKGC
uniref:thioredoxin-disulfide reductase (NADPH) n=1 Tax=Mantoniella antarctica TaxID=81844 RepID=A0A7S0X6A9_9CHLO